jgi:hypothetical protein
VIGYAVSLPTTVCPRSLTDAIQVVNLPVSFLEGTVID